MQRAEFHCHTIYSKDSLTAPDKLIAVCLKKGITTIVITDHNTITGAIHAKRLAPQLVVVGEEIMTKEGELLAFFVKEEIPAGLGAIETINLLRDQGAFISVSHPFDQYREGHWEERDLLEITPLIDAIETFNARCMREEFNSLAEAFANKYNLLGTVGSDAHTLMEVGKASLLLPDFNNRETLIEALASSEKLVSLSSPWIHLTSRYATWKKKVQIILKKFTH